MQLLYEQKIVAVGSVVVGLWRLSEIVLVLLHVYLDCHDTPTAAAGGKRLLRCVCIEEC